MKRITLSLLIFFAFFGNKIEAQECSEGLSMVSSLWEKLDLEQALVDPDAIIDEFNSLKGSLTSSLSSISFKKDAPKYLPMNGRQRKGIIRSNKKRVYVTYLVPKETLQIEILNDKHLSETEVIICAHDKTGKTENLEAFTFSLESPETSKIFELDGVKGRIISIAIKNKSVTSKFEYQITAQ